MLNRFLGQAYAGKSNTSHILLATLLTWGAYLLVGGIPMMLLIFYGFTINPEAVEAYIEDPANMALLGLPDFPLFVVVMLSFVIGMLGLIWGLRKIQKRTVQTIITGFGKIRWRRMWAGMALWVLLSGLGTLYNARLYPGSVIINPAAPQLLWFAIPALLLIPIQSAFEEMAIRGQLMQNISRAFQHPMVPLLLTSLIFALLHGMNNEVNAFGFLNMMIFYFSFGFSLGAIALMDEGLELPIGIHIGNNIFAFLFVTYPDSSIETPSFFIMDTIEIGDFWQFCVSIAVVFLVFFAKRRTAFRALYKNEPITPY